MAADRIGVEGSTLKTVVPGTYNQMSVDLDTSTNDTLIRISLVVR